MRLEFLDKIIPVAVQSEKLWGIPAEVTVGQAISESAWGNSLLARMANNYFGIKASPDWKGPTYRMRGYEWNRNLKKMMYSDMEWRKYNSLYDSVKDHATFLHRPRYSHAFDTDNYKDFLHAIQAAGYATDPDYANYIIGVIGSNNILDRIQKARDGGQSEN